MTTLHTLNTSAEQHSELVARLLRCISDGDALLLLGNGCYNLSNQHLLQTLQQKNIPLYAISNDARTRGLQDWTKNATEADDMLFVALSCQHSKVVSWFP